MKIDNNNSILSNNKNLKESIKINNEENFINNNNNNIESFKVYVRIRPNLPKDINIPKNSNLNNTNLTKTLSSPKNLSKGSFHEKTNMLKVDKNILYLEDIKNHKNKNNKIFIFDNVFIGSANNEMVFNESIKSMIDKILEGYNSTALAYGVTGTGKTYTIFGDLSNNFKDEGIIFKACDYLFEKIEVNKTGDNINNNIDYYIKILYIEIYNEIVKDLINENSTSLMIVEDPQKGVICPNAKEIIINDSVELKKIINEGNKRRTMASTNQNQFSSRSHAILQMTLEKKIKKSEDNYEIYFSKFLVVDLAGSERGMERGKRREEGVNINKSLFTLGSCLNILSEKSNMGKFVPYRDSKLTRLLKDSLGGNILTVMLACISPCPYNYDETLSTLNYAFKAKKITKKVMKNIKEIDINNLQYKEMIDTLKNEILQLKKIIKNQELKLKEKIINDKEEDINKENININENENNDKTLYINNKEIVETLETHGKKDSLNLRSFLDNNNILDLKESNEIIMSNTEKENFYKKKEIQAILNINKEENINEEDINIDFHNNYIQKLINNDFDINTLKNQIDIIKRDKYLLEKYLEKENNKDEKIINKYNSIKLIYDKYIEIINEKLVESIEQNMIYNFNIKEITELNKANTDKIKELEQYKLEKDDTNEKISEEINYTNKNIIENNTQKEQIYESIKKNNKQKDELKKLLLNLLENKANSMNKYIHILQEKDKLFKITKEYEKQIENYVKIQKQKDEDMIKINRKIEMLRAKLKEKDKKINELEKKGGFQKFLNNIKSYKSNYNTEKIKNGNAQAESQEKTKSPKSNYKCRLASYKRDNRNNNKEIKSPLNKDKKQTNTKKLSEMKNSEDKIYINNKSFNNNKKRLTLIPNNENNKITKKLNNNKYKTECNNENIKNMNDYFLQQKFNEIIVPKTTITLTDNITKNIEEMKPLYTKSIKENKIKKTSTNNLNHKKYSFINQQNSKINLSTNNNEDFFIRRNDKKKHSVKSVKINFKQNNNSELTLNLKSNENKSNKSDKSNNKIDNNVNIRPFKAEKINIDLTNLDKDSCSDTIKEKNNNINLLKLKNGKIKMNFKNDISKQIKSSKYNSINNKQINKISKSNPKISQKKDKNNQVRKLTLQEARFENKVKIEKVTNVKNELISAESFLNEYKKLKLDDTLKRKNIPKNMNNNSSTFLLNKEKEIEESDTKSYFIDIQNLKIDKPYNEVIDLNLDK